MSLILDALKRSEAERRQVRTKSPPADTADRRANDHRQRQGWIVLGAVAIVIGLGIGSAWWRAPAEKRLPTADPAAGVVSQPPPATVPAPSAPLPPDGGASRDERQTTLAPQAGSARNTETTAISMSTAGVAKTPEKGAEREEAPERLAEAEPAAQPPDPARRGPRSEPPPATQQAAAAPLDFARLPYATRQALGALRLDVHVFDADPLRRFVMVNGQTLGAGEELKPGLTVDQIVREGVVLTWKGQRFLLTAGD